ncbi:hypothetical protein [Acaryochloris marina]|uniref:DUF8082 domain-containing protein n=1 Tax=Acaryochloris marina (strain MBIC 11017) TaxID=329726 RepID=B0CGA2_ACAM1|nr:hypothetical protein [Acaryochloris marina]ABW30655.1 hypothetical protein AM1_5708 [Acaryochloris marina MBIC11017]BDM79442.1 hypothetical protein AM10699_23100 [Acaryochloris marina MBIC10699]
MYIIQSANLMARGILTDQSASLMIRGRWFRPGPAFAQSLRQIAIEFCEESLSQGRQYILIEFPLYFMAWRRFRPNQETQAQSSKSLKFTVNPQQVRPTTYQWSPAFTKPTFPNKQFSQSDRDKERIKTPKLGGAGIDHVLIKQCKAELAIHIGPMADYITEQTLNNSAQLSSEQLIAALAAHIPNTKAGLLFRWTLTKKMQDLNNKHV